MDKTDALNNVRIYAKEVHAKYQDIKIILASSEIVGYSFKTEGFKSGGISEMSFSNFPVFEQDERIKIKVIRLRKYFFITNNFMFFK
jgi:hypothetical protein